MSSVGWHSQAEGLSRLTSSFDVDRELTWLPTLADTIDASVCAPKISAWSFPYDIGSPIL
jgi:hypothetical protein